MKLKVEDFRGLKYDPFYGYKESIGMSKGSKELLDAYSDLKGVESWVQGSGVMGIREDLLMRWIFMVYQLGSPLLGIRDVNERKVEAARLCNFRRDGKVFTKEYMGVLSGGYDSVNKMIIDFCRLQKNPDFAEYVVYEGLFYDQLAATRGNKATPENVKKLLVNVQDLKGKMESLRKALMFGENNRAIIEAFLEEAYYEGLRLRREDIALALKDGVDPLDGYEVYQGYVKEYPRDKNADEIKIDIDV